MKKVSIVVSLAASLLLPAVALATPLEGLKFEQQKQQVVKDVKQNCPASSGLSDTQFANRVLESKDNKTAVQSATRALDKNDRSAYEKAINSIQCPTQ
ncbi:YicS family protein [Kluyvera sichuanensis]|uniref:YicS family protein n=1 Tax=Kluyvera sichuanensis TaxID=2725494 RepID=UPI0039F4A989